MPKKNQKYKLKRTKKEKEDEKPPAGEKRRRTPEEIKEYKKLAVFLFGWLILVAALYIACIQIEEAHWVKNQLSEGIPVTPLVYTIVGAALFLVWLIYNGGFKKIDFTQYEKPDEMGYDEYYGILEKLKERQRKAKYFLILFIPFIVVMLADSFILHRIL